MPSGVKLEVSEERVLRHPDMKLCFIKYNPSRKRCFCIETTFNHLSPKDLEQFLELATSALLYHKLSQEEKNAGQQSL